MSHGSTLLHKHSVKDISANDENWAEAAEWFQVNLSILHDYPDSIEQEHWESFAVCSIIHSNKICLRWFKFFS